MTAIDLNSKYWQEKSRHAPEIICILRMHLDSVMWYDLYYPKYKYKQLKDSRAMLHRELIEELYRPERITHYLQYHDNIDDYLP